MVKRVYGPNGGQLAPRITATAFHQFIVDLSVMVKLLLWRYRRVCKLSLFTHRSPWGCGRAMPMAMPLLRCSAEVSQFWSRSVWSAFPKPSPDQEGMADLDTEFACRLGFALAVAFHVGRAGSEGHRRVAAILGVGHFGRHRPLASYLSARFALISASYTPFRSTAPN